MRFSCPKEDLSRAISIANRAVAKNQQSILDAILFEAGDDGRVLLKATDRSLSITTELHAKVESPGMAAIPAKILTDFVNHLPDTEVTMDETGIGRIEISAQPTVGYLQKMDPQEFPMFPEMDLDDPVRVPTDLLTNMINQTSFAVATNSDRLIFTGILFDIQKDKLTMVALDGFRMAIRDEAVLANEKKQCVVPIRALREMVRSFGSNEEEVRIYTDGARVVFETNTSQFVSQLLEGTFMPYEKLFPATFATNIRIDRIDFLDSLERANIMCRDGETSIVRFEIGEEVLTLSGKSQSASSSFEEPLPIVMRGSELRIDLNAKYVMDVLRVLDDDEISMNFNTATTACTIERSGPGAYRYLVLPVQGH